MNWALLVNSIETSILATAVAGVIGFAAALFVMGLKGGVRACAIAFAAAAFAMPPFLVTNAWLGLLGPSGLLHRLLPFELASRAGVAWLLATLLWPVPMFTLVGAWQRLSREHFESDPLLHGTALFRWLLVPSGAQAMAFGLGLVFVLALNNFAVPAVLQVKVLPVEIYVLANTNLDYQGALLLSWPLVAAPLALLACLRHRKIRWPTWTAGVSASVWRANVGRNWFVGCGVVSIAVVGVSVLVPIFEPVCNGDTWRMIGSVWVTSGKVCAMSVCTATVGGVLAVALGFVLWRVRAGFLSWLLFLVPGVVLGILLIKALNRPPFLELYRSVAVMFIALALRYLAIGRTGVVLARNSVDRDVTDAAQLDGASSWQMWWRIYWPQMRTTLAVTWYIVFLLGLWDVETILFVVPPGGETLSLRIFNLLHYGHNPEINALCLLLLGVAALPPLVLVAVRTLGSKARSWFSTGLRQAAWSTATGILYAVLPGVGCGSVFFLGGCSQSPLADGGAKSAFFKRIEIIGSRGTAPGQFNKPRSLAVDRRDNLYVVDMTGRVQKFAPDGTWLLSWQMPETDLGRPKGMGIDKDGHVIVVEPHYSRINHFTSEGVLVRQWGQRGTNAGQLAFPRAVAVNRAGEILVSEYGHVDRVQRFSADGGKLLDVIGHYGYGPGQFNRPEGLGIDKEGRVYVADSCNHRIQVFGPDGLLLRSYGAPGRNQGQMSYPYDVCVDASGNQFVCEFGNSRIQVFDSEFRPVEVIGGPGRAPVQFANPWSVALDSAGNLYVADAGNDRVQKLIRH
ncbi:MAG: ABC transporter permease subunit [Verrucomicrobia bacterium]|nr:ABC transporter permease subunit [Verrucomicrobiota bacterium]